MRTNRKNFLIVFRVLIIILLYVSFTESLNLKVYINSKGVYREVREIKWSKNRQKEE